LRPALSFQMSTTLRDFLFANWLLLSSCSGNFIISRYASYFVPGAQLALLQSCQCKWWLEYWTTGRFSW
jgi:hypothetical protein